MNYTDIFLADLERETPVSRRVLLTVYLKLLGAKVPSIYGPSGDETAPTA